MEEVISKQIVRERLLQIKGEVSAFPVTAIPEVVMNGKFVFNSDVIEEGIEQAKKLLKIMEFIDDTMKELKL